MAGNGGTSKVGITPVVLRRLSNSLDGFAAEEWGLPEAHCRPSRIRCKLYEGVGWSEIVMPYMPNKLTGA